MKRPVFGPEWLWGLALFALAFLAYLPSLHGRFIWDDGVMVSENPMLRVPQGLRDFWITTKAVDPLPMTMSFLWLQWHCWGGHPMGYHIVGVLLHILGALLFWRVLLQFTCHPRLAWLGAAVFALHPVAVASAGWISEQKNTMSIIFYFLSMLGWLRFAGGGRPWSYWLALFLFVCALLSKGSVVMLPVVLLFIAWWKQGRLTLEDFWRVVPFLLLSMGAAIATIWIQNHKAIGGSMVQELNGPARLAAAGWTVWFYIWKGLLPFNLCVIYPKWHIDAASVGSWLPDLGLVAASAVCWHYRNSWGRHVLFGLGCFVVTLFPVLGFFNMYFLVYSRVADHWQYLALPALIGLAVCGGGGYFERAAQKFRWPAAIGPLLAAALLIVLFAGTWTRGALYTTERTLWNDTVNKNPNAWMAWNNLGNALSSDGETVAAIDAFHKALALHPNFPDAESNLGNNLVGRHRLDEAVFHLRKAVDEEPRTARFHFNYGAGLAAQGKLDEAVAQYQKALELQPRMADVRNNLASAFTQQKKFSAGLEQAQLAGQIDPALAEPHLNAAKALTGLGRFDEASREFETFLQMRPNNAGAHYDYGMMLALHGDLAGAIPQFQTVVKLMPNEAAGHSGLGNVLARLKRTGEAAAEFRAALRLQPDDAQDQNNLANALFEQGNIDEAIVHYSAAVNLNGAEPATRVNLAYALLRRGRKDEAITQLREALRLKPDPVVQKQLDALLSQQ